MVPLCIVEYSEETYRRFFDALLSGNRILCHRLTTELLESEDAIRDLYLVLYQRALYEIGSLWEQNAISVATEHLATSIIEGLFTLAAPILFSKPRTDRSAIICCVPGEYHQVGARIVADIFELHGWHSFFLGANTPVADVKRIVAERSPDLLALSLTLPKNEHSLMRMMEEMRNKFRELPIYVGGQAFREGGLQWHDIFPNTHYINSMDRLEFQLKYTLR